MHKLIFILFFTVLIQSNLHAEPCSACIAKEDLPWAKDLIVHCFGATPFVNVIIGSKPMAETQLGNITIEETLAQETNFENKSEEQKTAFLALLNQYLIKDNWNKWLAVKNKLPIRNFLFRTQLYDSDGSAMIINVREVLWTLEQYYSTFSRELNTQFDPLKVTLEFENQNSDFWNKVLKNHYLSGILFGFGQRNAYMFSNRYKLNNHDDEKGILLCSPISDTRPKVIEVPGFRSFHLALGEEDPVVQRFQQEVDKINKLLEGKDKFEVILEHLMQ